MLPARTFRAEVEGVGSFVFRKRTMALAIAIEAESDRITGGPVQNYGLAYFADAYAALKLLTAEAPPGWDLDQLDPLEPEDRQKVLSVHGGLRRAEDEFRGGPRPERERVGAAPERDGGVPVAA